MDANGWISVEERLPPENEEVLLAKGWLVTLGYFDGQQTCDSCEWIGDEGWHSDWEATHWRPLPPPPENKGK